MINVCNYLPLPTIDLIESFFFNRINTVVYIGKSFPLKLTWIDPLLQSDLTLKKNELIK